MQKNYYLILGINATANQNEIKTAYRELAKKYHPDKNNNNKAAEDYFKEIQQAYSVLSNHQKRKKYDLSFSFGTNYSSFKTNTASKQYTQYTGNAYQYAQQQAANNQKPFAEKKQQVHKPDTSERYQLLICVAIAVVLLIFIVSYSR